MSQALLALLAVHQLCVLLYFMLWNSYYLVTSLFSFRALHRYSRRLASIDIDDLIATAGAPPVTVIVPAYNEAATIVEASRSLLTLRYPDYEILIVNDGSTDATLEVLRSTYRLQPAPRFPLASIPTAPVRAIYQSQTHSNLWVIDKENGKRADAINAGINYCRTRCSALSMLMALLSPKRSCVL